MRKWMVLVGLILRRGFFLSLQPLFLPLMFLLTEDDKQQRPDEQEPHQLQEEYLNSHGLLLLNAFLDYLAITSLCCIFHDLVDLVLTESNFLQC